MVTTNSLLKLNKNAIANIINYVVPPILLFVTTPILVKKLGADVYGVWVIILSSIGMSSMFQFGLGDSTIRYISKYLAKSNYIKLNKVINATLFMYGSLSILAGIFCYLFSDKLVGLLNIGELPKQETVRLFKLVSIIFLFSFLKEAFIGILKGFERYDIIAQISVSFNIIKNFLFVFVVTKGFMISGLIIILLVSTIAELLVYILYVNTKISIVKFNIFKIDRETINEIFSYSFYTWLQGISTLLFSQLDKIIIGIFIGTKAVTLYSVSTQFASQIHAFGAAVFSYIFPRISALFEKGDYHNIQNWFKKLFKLEVISMLIITFVMLMFSNLFMKFWMGEHFAKESIYIVKGLIIAYAVLSLNIIPHYVLNGLGKVKLNLTLMTVTYIFSLILFIILTPLLGVSGMVYSKIFVFIPNIIYLVYTNISIKRLTLSNVS
ncbi:oligosaccharide flippase family protein [Heyndrickxia coagulans]|uniref:oligosaccharide flippase family protein n=1 Tax=Heyndrickxia coagulans TaxID=1398 RepID=UPI002E205102|nr:oligosaccharide flippase family protein [Heyndrickxia coagulans]MED4967021.1 oligosaccharide flippase family protein [Heyndrickxia coagulans]